MFCCLHIIVLRKYAEIKRKDGKHKNAIPLYTILNNWTFPKISHSNYFWFNKCLWILIVFQYISFFPFFSLIFFTNDKYLLASMKSSCYSYFRLLKYVYIVPDHLYHFFLFLIQRDFDIFQVLFFVSYFFYFFCEI